ncbi:hypothetical protein HMF8227_00594 [Saliniradius amylolyticus]|uniref:Uncharacterized protein n=1 Tax=Saliniradius amylolyticus TaxID=2183582 RepID=A0A2S2E1E9_9ALTE|nr:hypothetical protein [Saliniradius amylolyticus]AWL11090.1 hypothetical protein HMF8227_00594 [Saliniradius amylolyticus]
MQALAKQQQWSLVIRLLPLAFIGVVLQWIFTEAFTLWQGGLTLVWFALVISLSWVVTYILPYGVKDSLLFARLSHPLPSSRCHKVAKASERIDYEEAQRRWSDIFNDDLDPETRDDFWLKKIYEGAKDEEAVREATQDYLIYRDTFCGYLIASAIIIAWDCLFAGLWFGELNNAIYIVLPFLLLWSMFTGQYHAKLMVVESFLVPLSQPLSPIKEQEED